MNQSTFIGIGAQKAGTTQLSRFLASHPEVHMPAIKEMHFFNALGSGRRRMLTRIADDLRRRSRRLNLLVEQSAIDEEGFDQCVMEIESAIDRYNIGDDVEAYKESLKCPSPDQKIGGEFTPAYAIMGEERIQKISDALDRPKIIFLLRNPVDRFVSQVDFSRSVLARKQQKTSDLEVFLSREGYTERSRYEKTIKTLEKNFPEDDVLIGFFEDMVGPDAKAFHRIVCDFLDVDSGHAGSVVAGKVTNRKAVHSRWRRKLVREFSATYEFVRERMGRLPDSWAADMEEYGS